MGGTDDHWFIRPNRTVWIIAQCQNADFKGDTSYYRTVSSRPIAFPLLVDGRRGRPHWRNDRVPADTPNRTLHLSDLNLNNRKGQKMRPKALHKLPHRADLALSASARDGILVRM